MNPPKDLFNGEIVLDVADDRLKQLLFAVAVVFCSAKLAVVACFCTLVK